MKFITLLLIAIIWGSQFILNDEALNFINPFELAFYRVLFGYIVLSIILLLKKEPRIQWNKHLILLLLALTFCESLIPFVLNGFGQQEVNSSVTSVLMAFIPLITIILERAINKRPISTYEILGILIGFGGLVLLVSPDLLNSTGVRFLPILLIFLGACSFSVALILMAKIPKQVSSLRFTRAILFCSVLFALPLALIDNHINEIPEIVWYKLIALGSFASGIVYLMYLHLVRSSGPTFASYTNYLVPIMGVLLGVLLNNDNFSMIQYMGFFTILIGLFLTNIQSFQKLIR